MFPVFLVRAKDCFQQGNKEYRQGDFHRALQLYTEGLQLNCKDNRLTARLYNNRAAAHFRLGMEFQRSIIYSLLKSSSSKRVMWSHFTLIFLILYLSLRMT